MACQRTGRKEMSSKFERINDINERMPVPNTAYTQWREKCNKQSDYE